MSVVNNNLLLTADAGVSAYQISRSLRFNSADSAYANRTFSTPTTQGTFTLAMWVKRSALGTAQSLFGVSTNHSFGFTTGNALNLTLGGTSALTTTAVFRDASAWYHIVWTQSGTSHTVYVNGTSQGTATATSSVFNTAVAHQIGASNTANYFNGYLADVHFIDGQALTPSSFTETNATTGQLVPKAFSGSYGVNGFRLNFSDNSAATAATLGADSSGNGNNWTPNNLSVTAGAGNDSLTDTPTSYGTDTGTGGVVRGNYATWNPLAILGTASTINNGNLTFPGGTNSGNTSTIGMTSGKWYWEITFASARSNQLYVGITNVTGSSSDRVAGMCAIRDTGGLYNGNGATTNGSGTTAFDNNDVVNFAYDADNKRLFIGKNNTWLNSANPAAGTNATYTNVQGSILYAGISENLSSTTHANFGQRPFAYTAPTGFKTLVDTHLPTPTIAKGSSAFDTLLWSGTGGSRSFSSLSMSPDLVWIKQRNAAFSTGHQIYDIVRGAGAEKELNSSGTGAEGAGNIEQYGYLSSFDANGFSVTPGSVDSDYVNKSAITYVAWAWDAGSSTVTNTAGTITSQVRANASAGFSVGTYTGTGANATVGHELGVAPSMVIVKRRDTTGNWQVRHVSIAATNSIQLNLANAAAAATTVWNSTAPSSTVFSIGSSTDVNASAGTYVAYCFAPVTGYSSFGSYTGNGSADGPFVYLGFRPAFLMMKRTNTTGNWVMLDSKREGYNVDNDPLYANLTSVEGTDDLVDITSNGFKLRSTNADVNASGSTYIYAAFAENPFQFARAR